ncbi:hypothetical protein AYO44_14500 [Planctomycetaceae bacterium SCGC AG-212-F19]|nr:hypothetical protein AYO44_14500 [Planctomycetaceae bacterium SCGC AG-212-F19]
MPIHDWTRVDAGLFHDFHQRWTAALSNALNAGGLPRDYFALVEQRIQGPIADVLTLKLATRPTEDAPDSGGITVAAAPPQTRLVRRSDRSVYADKANRITVRHRHGDVVAVIEIISPGNKGSKADFRAFVEKSADLVRQGVHLLVVDLFPPGRRDPQGIHNALWDEFEEEELERPADKPLTLVSYDAGPERVAYVEFVAVGDVLPDMPIFLKPGYYVPAPLETTYQSTWNAFPAVLKGLLETTAAPPR